MPIIHFDCSEGKHKEANEIYRRNGGRSYCWGWSRTHTYEFSDPVIVTRIVGEVNTGPSEAKSLISVDIELSKDGGNWIKVGEVKAKGTEGYKPFDIQVNNITAKYLRFISRNGFVDGSRGSVYYSEVAPIPPAPPTPPPKLKILRVNYPESAKVGERVVIVYDVHNEGATGRVFGRIRDKDTNEVIERSKWFSTIPSNKSARITFDMILSKTLNATIEVGHDNIVDDKKDITIVVSAPPAPPTPPPTPPTPPEQPPTPPTPPEQPPTPPTPPPEQPPAPPISKAKIGLIVAGLFVAGIIAYGIVKRRR